MAGRHRCARARRRHRRPRWWCARRTGRCRPNRANRRRSPVPAADTPSTPTRPRTSSRGTRRRSLPSRRCSTPSRTRRPCRCASKSPTPTAASRCRRIPARPWSGASSRPGRLRATRSAPPVRDVELADGTRVWAAGEAAAVQRIRRHLFDDRGLRALADRSARLLEARPRRWRRRRRVTSRRSSRSSSRRISAELREGEVVKPLELFFDLVFVLAFTQCTALMAAQPTWEGIGRGMLVLAMLWWAWVGYAWLTSVIEPEEGAVRIAMFAAMAALLVAALCVPEAFGDRALAVRDRVRDGARRADRALPDRQPRRPRAPPLGRRPGDQLGDRGRAARRRVVPRRRRPGGAVGDRDPDRLGRPGAVRHARVEAGSGALRRAPQPGHHPGAR